MKKQTNKGFTLVELLMVIAIIGLLASILIPTVGTVRENATIAAGKSQLSQYVNAVLQFKNEYGYYPFARGTKDYVIDLSDPAIFSSLYRDNVGTRCGDRKLKGCRWESKKNCFP